MNKIVTPWSQCNSLLPINNPIFIYFANFRVVCTHLRCALVIPIVAWWQSASYEGVLKPKCHGKPIERFENLIKILNSNSWNTFNSTNWVQSDSPQNHLNFPSEWTLSMLSPDQPQKSSPSNIFSEICIWIPFKCFLRQWSLSLRLLCVHTHARPRVTQIKNHCLERFHSIDELLRCISESVSAWYDGACGWGIIEIYSKHADALDHTTFGILSKPFGFAIFCL